MVTDRKATSQVLTENPDFFFVERRPKTLKDQTVHLHGIYQKPPHSLRPQGRPYFKLIGDFVGSIDNLLRGYLNVIILYITKTVVFDVTLASVYDYI